MRGAEAADVRAHKSTISSLPHLASDHATKFLETAKHIIHRTPRMITTVLIQEGPGGAYLEAFTGPYHVIYLRVHHMYIYMMISGGIAHHASLTWW